MSKVIHSGVWVLAIHFSKPELFLLVYPPVQLVTKLFLLHLPFWPSSCSPLPGLSWPLFTAILFKWRQGSNQPLWFRLLWQSPNFVPVFRVFTRQPSILTGEECFWNSKSDELIVLSKCFNVFQSPQDEWNSYVPSMASKDLHDLASENFF